MTDNTQPLALMLADRLHHEQPLVLRIDAEHAGEELRQQARITELESQLAQRFDAADMATAAAHGFRDGATAPAQPVAAPATQQGVAYAALPTHSHAGRVYEEGFLIGTYPLYTADKMRAFADAAHTLRASHGQAPATAQADGVPAVDQSVMELAESVGLIGPTGDLNAAIQRFHDLICVNATIKAATMAAEVISSVAMPDLQDAVVLLRKYRRLCQEVGRGDSAHLDRIEAAAVAVQTVAACAPADSVPAVEREQERIAFKDAHRHLELYEVPDAWGRPMFKHSHVEASWLGWIARASRGQAPAKTGNYVSAQPDSVQEDAALWHWLAEYLVGTRTDLDDEIVASETVNDLRKLVEAAIKQGASQ